MSVSFGLDTSNYTTSAALYDSGNGKYVNSRRLLEVDAGNVGLRQSDALFKHIKNLPEIVRSAFSDNKKKIDAVGVSDRPRSAPGSYMPCFLAGVSSATAVAAAMGKPIYMFSHQSGHIAAALLSSGHTELLNEQFISFHVSGGTTEALLVTRDKDTFFSADIVGRSLDLKMGQAVDRVGNMLGLPFPAGKYLDKLSLEGTLPAKPRVTLRDTDCCISGLQNQAENLLKKGALPSDVALYTITYLKDTLDKMTAALKVKYGDLPFVFAGGVMSNSIIRRHMTSKYGAYFASPELSGDNAVGIAIMTDVKFNENR